MRTLAHHRRAQALAYLRGLGRLGRLGWLIVGALASPVTTAAPAPATTAMKQSAQAVSLSGAALESPTTPVVSTAANIPATPTTPTAPGSRVLFDALIEGDLKRLAANLAAGADPNDPLADHSLPLAWAIEQQNTAAVRLLLQAGATVNATHADANAFHPLFVACLHPQERILTMLLNAGASPATQGAEQISALALCAAYAPTTVVRRMIAMGADVNAVDANGQTPLMWAAAHGRLANFEMLLDAGADHQARSNGGFSPLLFAVKSGSAAMAARALEAGGSLLDQAPDGTSLVQLAMLQGNYGFASELIARGADLTARDLNGHQLLHSAVLGGQQKLVAQLTRAGADVDARTGPSTIPWRFESNFKAGSYEFPRSPPLVLAAQAGNAGLMKLLLNAGAEPTAKDSDGNSALLMAAASGNLEALTVALAVSPTIDEQNQRGATALHRVLATASGATLAEMLALLATYDARTDLADARGRTARQIGSDPYYKGRATFLAQFPEAKGPQLTNAPSAGTH